MSRPGTDIIGRPQIAVGVIFSTSVACLSLILGVANYMSPLTTLPNSRKLWPFLLPASLLAMVSGFNGQFTIIHAGMFALLGVAILNFATVLDRDEVPESEQPTQPKAGWTRWLQLSLAILLALVAGWAMTRGASLVEQSSRVLKGVVLASTVIGPLLTMPVLGTASKLAERHQTGSAISTLVTMALINLCAILPIVIVAHHVQAWMNAPEVSASIIPTTVPTTQPTQAVPFPLISWRIDSVLLVVLGFAMIPWSLGRWTISRLESLGLILAYAIYLALVAILSIR